MRIQDTWRVTEEEFYNRALDYLVDHVLKIQSIIINDPKYFIDPKKVNLINSKIKEVGEDLVKAKTGNYTFNKKDLVKSLLDICLLDIKDWSAFSLNKNSRLDDIMIRTLLNIIFNKSYVCYCYISSNNNICEEFIDDLMYVTSGIFSFKDWDDAHVSAVSYCIINEIDPKESEKMRKLYSKKFIDSLDGFRHNPCANNKGLNANKLDFDCIQSRIKNNKRFRTKYANLMK